jgi:uncharacterized protein
VASVVPIDVAIVRKFMAEFFALPVARGIFYWHGGEPMLAGRRFFEEIVEIQTSCVPNGKTVRNYLQVNGTLINDSWIDFITKHDFRVGLSFDGLPTIHDEYRVDHAGHPSSARVLQGIHQLNEAGVDFGVMVVVTPLSIGHEKEIFDFLIANGMRSLYLLNNPGRVNYVPCQGR